MLINIHKFHILMIVTYKQLFSTSNYIYIVKLVNYQWKTYLFNVLWMIPVIFKLGGMERVKSLASGEENITLAKLSKL